VNRFFKAGNYSENPVAGGLKTQSRMRATANPNALPGRVGGAKKPVL
jgi:hypothetical protein